MSRSTMPSAASSSMHDWMGAGSAGTKPVPVLAHQLAPAAVAWAR